MLYHSIVSLSHCIAHYHARRHPSHLHPDCRLLFLLRTLRANAPINGFFALFEFRFADAVIRSVI